MSLLDVRNLSVSFTQDGATNHAVKNVSFSVEKGETVAIVGESGSGKSVTALSTVSLLPGSAEVTGSVRYGGAEMIGAKERELRRVRGNDISFIFQEPMTSLNPLHTLETQLEESLALHQGLRGAAARARILELMTKVGIRDPESRLGAYPHQLSGGQRQRVMIAMALANGPDLLVADEPTTALDVTIQAQILELLADLKREEGLSLLFITHDLGIVRRIADRVCVMKDGEIVETGPTEEIFANPRHPYTRKLLEAEATGGPDPVRDFAETIVETEHLKVWFPIQAGLLRRTVGHVKAVNDATISVREGETLGIVGESGSGKTTLALAVMRLLSSEGRISLAYSWVPRGSSLSTYSAPTMANRNALGLRLMVLKNTWPPGFTSLAQARITDAGSGTCSSISRQVTASYSPARCSAISSASTCRYSTSTPLFSACRRATARGASPRSMPVTVAPRRAMPSESRPPPQPMSITFLPGRPRRSSM